MSVKELCIDSNDGEETETKEIKEIESSVSSVSNDTWVNQKRNPIKLPITCRIPQKIEIVLRTIERIIIQSGMGTMEFGLFVRGKFENEIFILDNDFYVPSQKVSGASIDFEEEPPAGCNGVIHRHPNGCNSFSGVDDNYINKNFEFSLLYVNNSIHLGILNLEVNGYRIQLPLKIEISYAITNLDENEITTKIQRKEIQVSSTSVQTEMGLIDRRDIRSYLKDGNISDESGDDDQDDEDDETMYNCKKCGELQFISMLPHTCTDCGSLLVDENDIEKVNDLVEENKDIMTFGDN